MVLKLWMSVSAGLTCHRKNEGFYLCPYGSGAKPQGQYVQIGGRGRGSENPSQTEGINSDLADAYKTSQEIRGAGEARALDIYASSFSKDPKFYEFVRTLETYEKVIDKKLHWFFPEIRNYLRN